MNAVSPRGLALIKSFESCRLTAYQDQHGVWTIGWGHTGPEVVAGLWWTQAHADVQLEIDAHGAVNAVNRSLDVAVNQNQFDALVDFTFNLGAGNEAHSTLLYYINAGNFVSAAAEFPKWNHVGGVPNAGLARRRAAEQALFTSGV